MTAGARAWRPACGAVGARPREPHRTCAVARRPEAYPMTRPARRIGVFPGQFDPITNGHLDVIQRGKVLFDDLIVAVGVNPDKRELFSLDERVALIRGLIRDLSGVHVEKYGGLTVDF